jgi:Ca2+:H+ antiporter
LRPVYYLSIFIPIAIGLNVAGASAPLVFFASALGVVPTAALMSDATEQLAARAGPGIGGLLNVTFGNAPELIIAFFALEKGLQEVVKASLVGSVIGNSLLVLGASMLAGGIGRERQTFNRTAAHTQAGMLLLATAALVLPAVFQLIHGGSLPNVSELRHNYGSEVEKLSLVVAVILIGCYVAGLFFSLKTHRDLFNAESDDDEEEVDANTWTIKRSVVMLAVAGVLVGIMSEILVGSIEEASRQIGLSQFFVGVFVVAIVGNAAEHYVAVVVARKNKMDLSVNIAIGSSAQIALFVAPVLVLLSFVVGPNPMALVFNGYELAGLIAAVLIANFLASEGESTWFEGVQLLALYAVLGFVFALA